MKLKVVKLTGQGNHWRVMSNWSRVIGDRNSKLLSQFGIYLEVRPTSQFGPSCHVITASQLKAVGHNSEVSLNVSRSIS